MCADWPFRQIIPCHFTAPIKAGPADLRRAFAFAYDDDDVPAAAAAAAPADGPAGFLAGLLGRLQAAAGGAKPAAKPQRAVDFLEADIRVLRGLNWLLLRSGAVKANVDRDD
jgi:hypothetical protein